jgi:hypothetical protein
MIILYLLDIIPINNVRGFLATPTTAYDLQYIKLFVIAFNKESLNKNIPDYDPKHSKKVVLSIT